MASSARRRRRGGEDAQPELRESRIGPNSQPVAPFPRISPGRGGGGGGEMNQRFRFSFPTGGAPAPGIVSPHEALPSAGQRGASGDASSQGPRSVFSVAAGPRRRAQRARPPRYPQYRPRVFPGPRAVYAGPSAPAAFPAARRLLGPLQPLHRQRAAGTAPLLGFPRAGSRGGRPAGTAGAAAPLPPRQGRGRRPGRSCAGGPRAPSRYAAGCCPPSFAEGPGRAER